jgi:3-keto-5-aminohexanoate cleavage enzyme
MDKLIVNAAITGMVPTKADNPNVPITVDEIVADIRRVRDAGASIVHVHARDENGAPTYRREIYQEIISRARAACPDLLISGSTSGRAFKEFSQRSQVLECAPDLGSLTLGSMNFPKQPSVNAPDMIQALAQAMNARGIVPEWEIFDLGMIDYAHYLISKNILRKPYYGNILLGSLGALSATPFNLVACVQALPREMVWSATGIGRFQFFVNTMAITMGGHVRVGLEDNVYLDEAKTKFATNAGLVERVVGVARAVGREIASPDEARTMIGLSAREREPMLSAVG